MARGNSRELCDYKQKVVSQILETDTIIEALASDVDASELLYHNIFPHGYIPDMVEEAKCYITVEVTMPQVSTVNYFFKDVLLIVTVISHTELMKTDYGMPRTDYIAVELDKLLNDSEQIGIGKMELVSNTEGMFNEKHCCRVLRFQTQELAKAMCDEYGYYLGAING